MVILENGWIISVINNGYGKEENLLEIGLKNPDIIDFNNWKIKGWLSFEDVYKLIKEIEKNPIEIYNSLSY
jgi:hypothetical protein